MSPAQEFQSGERFRTGHELLVLQGDTAPIRKVGAEDQIFHGRLVDDLAVFDHLDARVDTAADRLDGVYAWAKPFLTIDGNDGDARDSTGTRAGSSDDRIR